MRHLCQLACLVALNGLDGTAFAQGVELHFSSFDNLVVVEGRIGSARNLRFVVDTGTTSTVIDQGIASKLKLPTTPLADPVTTLTHNVRASRVIAPSLEVGSIRLDWHPLLAMDLRCAYGTGRIDGILGLDVLRRANFQIDYEAHRLTIGPLTPARSSTPFQTMSPLLTVNAYIEKGPVRLIVDTGAMRLTLFTKCSPSALGRLLGGIDIFGAVGRTRVDAVEIRRVQLGQTIFKDYNGALLSSAADRYEGLDGILGGFAHVVRKLGFDFDRGRLQWE